MWQYCVTLSTGLYLNTCHIWRNIFVVPRLVARLVDIYLVTYFQSLHHIKKCKLLAVWWSHKYSSTLLCNLSILLTQEITEGKTVEALWPPNRKWCTAVVLQHSADILDFIKIMSYAFGIHTITHMYLTFRCNAVLYIT